MTVDTRTLFRPSPSASVAASAKTSTLRAISAIEQAAVRAGAPYPAGSYQFDPIDADPFYVTASTVDFSITPGKAIKPEVTVAATVADIVALSAGVLSGANASAAGRLVVGGTAPRRAVVLGRWLRRTAQAV